VVDLEGKELALSDLDQQVVVVIFFLHTCPHCHDSLRYLEKLRTELERDDLTIVAINVQDRPDEVRRMGDGLDLGFPLYLDPEGAAVRAYAHAGAVPDTLVLDREHRVVGRHAGFESRIEALLTMSIRHALGVTNPILLTRSGYSGTETCAICHTSQHETFSLTNHAYAFDTLVEHGSNRDPECLPCHTVGWDEAGGYTAEKPRDYLEGVQCESCHGRGGPHQSPDFLAAGFEQVCVGCHTAEHSLRFDFAERLPLISHAANLQFAKLDADGRRALLDRRAKRDRQLFDEADFVGSESCQSCHAAEYERWSKSDHARSFVTLAAHDADQNADCQSCHTTGFASDGGFPGGGARFEHVGCESCHGPGGNHVAESARKDGTILALTDKCDSCVVLQICGSCHDDANDPGFEFEVLDKIELIRHGFRDRPAPGSAE
jgi:predicted CXXCH cytochrome family protein